MNAEPSPVYGKREFSHGPLNLLDPTSVKTDTDGYFNRHIMLHPDDPMKLIRASGNGTYYNAEEMNEKVSGTQQVLKGLSEHGVSHVNPVYIDQTSENGDAYHITVVDRVYDFQPFDEIIHSPELTSDQIEECDAVIGGMLNYVMQVIRQGGYIDPEMMHLSQFVYDDSRPKKARMVLVDVEAIGVSAVEPEADCMRNGLPMPLLKTVAELCIDIINLAQRTEYELLSLSAAIDIVEALPGDPTGIFNAKMALLEALETNEINRRVVNLANGNRL